MQSSLYGIQVLADEVIVEVIRTQIRSIESGRASKIWKRMPRDLALSENAQDVRDTTLAEPNAEFAASINPSTAFKPREAT